MGHAYCAFAMGRAFLNFLVLIFVFVATNDCGRSPAGRIQGVMPVGHVSDNPYVDFNLEPVIQPNQDAPVFVPKSFTKDQKTGQLTLRADVGDEKDLNFIGSFDENGKAHLVSSDVTTDAWAVCTDEELCNEMAVTINKGKDYHQQFITSVSPDSPSEVQVTATASGDEEIDEGLGADEYVISTKDENPKNSKRPRPLGPHARYVDKKTGKVTYGKLANGIPFPLRGPGFFVRDQEDGIWTTDTIVNLITQTAGEMDKLFSNRPPLEIGDIAKKGGGFYPPHISHENGLDIDIAYPTLAPRQEKKWESMVTSSGLNPNFDIERFWFISKRLVELSNVPFIFVDKKIKSAICQYVKSKNEYPNDTTSPAFKALLAMRPPSLTGAKIEDHRNHFHVRQQCATDGCQTTKVPGSSEGTGCPLSI